MLQFYFIKVRGTFTNTTWTSIQWTLISILIHCICVRLQSARHMHSCVYATHAPITVAFPSLQVPLINLLARMLLCDHMKHSHRQWTLHFSYTKHTGDISTCYENTASTIVFYLGKEKRNVWMHVCIIHISMFVPGDRQWAQEGGCSLQVLKSAQVCLM